MEVMKSVLNSYWFWGLVCVFMLSHLMESSDIVEKLTADRIANEQMQERHLNARLESLENRLSYLEAAITLRTAQAGQPQ